MSTYIHYAVMDIPFSLREGERVSANQVNLLRRAADVDTCERDSSELDLTYMLA